MTSAFDSGTGAQLAGGVLWQVRLLGIADHNTWIGSQCGQIVTVASEVRLEWLQLPIAPGCYGVKCV